MLNDKKILVITTTDNMIWQFLIPHIKRLQERGNVVECVCAKTGFWFDELTNKYGFKMHEISFERNPFKFKNFKAYNSLKKLQKDNNYEVIYCQQPVGALMGRLLGKKFKIPVIYTAHGFHFYKKCSIKNKILYKTAEKWLSKYTDVLITINDEDFEAAKKFNAKQVYKISGIGFDGKKYNAPVTNNRSEIKKALGLNEDDFVITTIAEFIKRKNYNTMLKVVSNLKYKIPNLKFLICGTGKLENNIKVQIKNLNLDNIVKILGYRRDINKILTISDVFMLPSYHEGLTLSVIEAMNFGVPCVVSDVRGNRDLIINNKGGFVFPPNDSDNFANSILKIYNDKTLASNFSSFNKNQSKKYSIENVLCELDNIYNSIE